MQEGKNVSAYNLKRELERQGFEFTTHIQKLYLFQYADSIFGNVAGAFNPYESGSMRSTPEGYIRSDAYQSLLDYRELEEARTSARSARIFAIISIVISALLAIASIILTIIQFKQPIMISDKQFIPIIKSLEKQK